MLLHAAGRVPDNWFGANQPLKTRVAPRRWQGPITGFGATIPKTVMLLHAAAGSRQLVLINTGRPVMLLHAAGQGPGQLVLVQLRNRSCVPRWRSRTTVLAYQLEDGYVVHPLAGSRTTGFGSNPAPEDRSCCSTPLAGSRTWFCPKQTEDRSCCSTSLQSPDNWFGTIQL